MLGGGAGDVDEGLNVGDPLAGRDPRHCRRKAGAVACLQGLGFCKWREVPDEESRVSEDTRPGDLEASGREQRRRGKRWCRRRGIAPAPGQVGGAGEKETG